ncbi:MarR family transcriptional regulator [Bacillus thuringiensis]|uniref:MarR family transcriptional regulator n=1 Tax=Bacillus thuringiensis TaxID=1428 RepID=UPI002D808806|nr:MarR family transcriptional regulator [Bacillus thuringiensis]MEB4819160.1 MarR family transcriptional regulator [Bacillus thuringiensis]
MTNTIDFKQVEKNARIRDFENENEKFKQDHNGINQEEVNQAMQVLSKATGGKEVFIGTKRSPQSRVKFAQFIQDNIDQLEEINYLDNKEIVVIWKISRKIGFLSNCIVDDIHKKNPVPLTQTEIALLLKRTKNNINPIIKSLVDKGILAVSEIGIAGNNVRANAYFMNPNIIFAGNKDDVNPTLKAMFHRVPKELKNLPVKLF